VGVSRTVTCAGAYGGVVRHYTAWRHASGTAVAGIDGRSAPTAAATVPSPLAEQLGHDTAGASALPLRRRRQRICDHRQDPSRTRRGRGREVRVGLMIETLMAERQINFDSLEAI
jgi:hypothetical protein